MAFSETYRDPALVAQTIQRIHTVITQPWTIMEICGGQTHALMQHGFDDLLPKEVELVHGPGCPVCVTPLELIDKGIAIAQQKDVIFTSYGDMLRVPGSAQDLFSVRAAGRKVKIVYSPIEALQIARNNPDKQVVFFAIGFETTAPANALSVLKAKELDLKNYSMLVSQVRVPPAIRTILSDPQNRVQGFLAAGHVCSVMGYHEYIPLAQEFHLPIVVTGFEPLDLALGIFETIQALEKNKDEVINAYSRAVVKEGNQKAQEIIEQVYESCDQKWRGIGTIAQSGWKLNPAFADFDAEKRFDVGQIQTKESEICISGLVLQGRKKPFECPAFGTLCTPENPLGATMVSSEGTCAAYYRYQRK
ncbi:MAG: hydrogenase formation protein HypD [Anaerolineaceae bacterium]